MATSTLATIAAISLNRDYSIAFTLNPVAVAIIAGVVGIFFAVRWWWLRKAPNFTIDTAEMNLGGGKISFKPNIRDQEIAYKIWVELSTRKIGLPIDLHHDVIAEVYDSWHNFFSITRELIKDIPVSKVKRASTRQIITLSISVLNEGLRPHLTSWQARFRMWYEKQLAKEGEDVDPQSIQQKYPRYSELTKELLEVNEQLMKYREKMRELVLGLSTDSTQAEAAPPPAAPVL